LPYTGEWGDGRRRRGTDLHNAPQIHDGDAVTDVAYHGQVVRDEEIREPELVLQIREQVDDLGLGGHVERAHGLVAHEQARVQSQRARDGNALTLSPRELVRIPPQVMPTHPNELEEVSGPLVTRLPAQPVMDLQRLAHGGGNRGAGVERRIRVL